MASQLTGRERRDFWSLTLAQFLLFCGFTMFFQFPLFIKALGGGEREIGWIMGLSTVASSALLPWVAMVVGQVDRKRLMLAGGLLLSFSVLACRALDAVGFWMAALMALRGLGFVVYLIANGAYVAHILPARERSRWFSIYFAFWSLASAVGPGVGEIVVLRFGFGAFFLTSFAVLLLATLFTLAVSSREPAVQSWWINPLVAVTRFFSELTAPRFRYLFLTLLVMTGGFSSVLTFSATFLRGQGLSSGMFFAAYATVSVSSRVWGGGLSDRFGRRSVALPTLILLSVGLLLYSFTAGQGVLLASGAVIGLAFGLANPTISAQMIDRAPIHLQGIAVGGYQFAFNLGMMLSTPALGFIADRLGYPVMWRIASALVLGSVLIYIFRGQRGERSES